MKPQRPNKKFIWQGINSEGINLSGVIEAENLKSARILLLAEDIRIKNIKIEAKIFLRYKKIKVKDITIFTRQLASLLVTGIPLMQALDVIIQGIGNEKFKKILKKIRDDTKEGFNLSTTLKKHSNYFNSFYCSLITTGEKIGALGHLLERLATYREKSEAIKAKIKKTFVYPIAILIMAVIISVIILIFVIPQFASLYSTFGANLPYLTQLVIRLSNFLNHYYQLLLLTIFISISSIKYLYTRNSSFRHSIERVSLKLPKFGNLLQKSIVARFARTLATTVSAGIPIVEGLDAAAESTGNIIFELAIRQILYEVKQGKLLSRAINNVQCFPEMLYQMVAVGEETGDLETMLKKVAEYYEEEVDNVVAAMSTLVEPILMLVLGLIIGGLVIAMYLPLFNMGSIV